MAIFTERQLRARADKVTIYKSAEAVLREHASQFSEQTEFDIFLCHAKLDEKLILGVEQELKDFGFSVYIDWRVDPELDRGNVTAENAKKLRKRMEQSKCLVYARSANSSESIWMPWELGYMDGRNGKAAVLPIVSDLSPTFYRSEYLGIYPWVDKAENKAGVEQLWVNYDNEGTDSRPLKTWIAPPAPPTTK